ncbi:hypothetical protein PR003_g21072 [Phytophthora rubi]|uniref:Uncharacterized protein n=1 Tax=Phytophthora rubi TaxID=129364 RepID=A0A6A4DHB2_9STRA|nr:hypothetical protein PR002_g18899 [Phytophthora rubi]KAE9307143.1 hypothetical protein PR003_g21072 [Phytophthora rubi]
MSVEELQRDRDRLKHALREAEQKVEQAYEAAEVKMSKCIEALQATITRTEGQEKLVVQLLQEAKKKAEASERSARDHAKSLQLHLDTMTKRALAAEEKLARSEKETARLTSKLDQVSGKSGRWRRRLVRQRFSTKPT